MHKREVIFRKWRIFAIVFIMSLFTVLPGYGLDLKVDGEHSELVKNSILNNSQSYRFVGGDIVAGSAPFTVDRLKYGRHADFERLVFCINETDFSNNYLPTSRPPRYGFALSADKTRAEVRITAYQSKVDEVQLNNAADSELIAKVEELKVCDWRWYFISFKQPVEIKLFDLSDPGRIVLDITPEK